MSTLTRRRFLTHSALAGGALAAGGLAGFPSRAAEAIDSTEWIDEATDAAIKKGLEYLAGRQQADGSFPGSGYSRNLAVCSLTGMAFMAAGSTPMRGPYGLNTRRCVDYVMEHTTESGLFVHEGSSSHGPMYEHGFATLFLAEAYGMTMRRDIREKLAKAVRLIVETQNDEGGWRYQPVKSDADISVTVCQMMALRAAKNAGLFVPNVTRDRCIDYVKKSQNDDGGFMYMVRGGGGSAFPRSAAGVVALYSAGYSGPEVEKGLAYLMKHIPAGDMGSVGHYFYGHYYAVQAMWHAGGEWWKKWYPAIREELTAVGSKHRQQDDGSWVDGTVCAEYGTAMACIILQMPNNYLPIFQR
jgi:prenyltransferase beta subunit